MTTPKQPIRSVKWGLKPRSNKRPQIGENMAYVAPSTINLCKKKIVFPLKNYYTQTRKKCPFLGENNLHGSSSHCANIIEIFF